MLRISGQAVNCYFMSHVFCIVSCFPVILTSSVLSISNHHLSVLQKLLRYIYIYTHRYTLTCITLHVFMFIVTYLGPLMYTYICIHTYVHMFIYLHLYVKTCLNMHSNRHIYGQNNLYIQYLLVHICTHMYLCGSVAKNRKIVSSCNAILQNGSQNPSL